MAFATFGRRFPSHGGMPHILTIFLLLSFTTSVSAFGAGTTSSDAGKWRHGDIENALLGLMLAQTAGGVAFSRMDVKRVYFGNWLRDYSQLMDVGSLKVVGPNILRTMVSLFAFMTFGYGTGEFEVTDSRLSVYRPEEHIDNPKYYANNIDAKKYDSRLRGVVDEDLELFPDDRTGMKGYIANERLGVTTTAGYVRKALSRCIKLGRQHAKKKNIKDFDDALRHLGAALHALEDFPAHSNYIELALRELGETGVFPHVGTATAVDVQGNQVFPLVTGSFGTVDFLSSVVGGDPKNPGPSELQQMEEQITTALQADGEHGGEVKILRDLFASLPKNLLDERCIANLGLLEEQSVEKQKAVQTRADDGEPVDLDAKDLYDQIYPILEMHDRVVREIVYGMDNAPAHAETYQKIQASLNTVTFTLIAPYILPVLQQIRIELAESANELILTSEDKEGEVFTDPYCSDPVHSVIAKDNATSILSEPAGRIAVEIVRFVVPLIMRSWDEQDMDVEPLISYILGVFHHPVTRNEKKHRGQAAMFRIVEDWWTLKSDDEKDDMRAQLSMDGIKEKEHRHGTDFGHGGLKPLAGSGVFPGDATGGIFTPKKMDDTEPPDAEADKAVDPPDEASAGDVTAAAVAQEKGKSRRRRDREGKGTRDRENRGSQSPDKREREHRKRRNHDEAGAELPEERVRESGRRHRAAEGGNGPNDMHRHHHRHRDEPEFASEEKPPEKSRISQMFSSGFNYFGFGGAGAGAAPEPVSPRLNGSADRNRTRGDGSDDRHRRHRHRHDSERETLDSPSRQKSSRHRRRPGSDEEAAANNDAPPPEGEGEQPAAADVPDAEDNVPPGEDGAGGEAGKSSKRRSSRRREGHRSRKEGGEPVIPEEGGDYFQSRHAEQDLRSGSKAKANKILGVDAEANGDSLKRSKTKRRHTDRELGEKRRHDDEPVARTGFFGRIASKADKFLGRDATDEGARPLERRRTGDRDHSERSRKRYPDDEDKKRRRHRSVTLPVQIDPTDFAEAGPAPEGGIPGSFPGGEEDRPATPTDGKKRHRRHKSSPNALQFDVASDGSGSDEAKNKTQGESEMPELQDVSGLGIETGEAAPESKSRRRRPRRERDYDETPTPSPRKERRKRAVNFEDAADSGDAPKREKSRRHRSSRDEAEEGDGSRERRRRDRKRDSAVFGGYGRD